VVCSFSGSRIALYPTHDSAGPPYSKFEWCVVFSSHTRGRTDANGSLCDLTGVMNDVRLKPITPWFYFGSGLI